MSSAPSPASSTGDPLRDPARLAALRASGLLEDGDLDSLAPLTRLARRLIGAPVALVTLVGAETTLVAASEGYDGPREAPAARSCCRLVVQSGDAVTIADVRRDARTRGSAPPWGHGLIAYAGAPLLGPGGHVLGAVCAGDRRPRAWRAEDVETLRDLAAAATARMDVWRATERLRESEERYRAVAETSNDVVWSLDADGRMVLLSGTASELFGYPVDDLVGLPFAELMAPDAVDDALEHFARVLAGETLRGYESRVRGRDGGLVDVVINATAHRDGDGRLHVVGTTSDVSARKRAERELRFLADHDTLTDLFNRRRFEEELGRQVDRAARYGESGAVLVLDIDNFKYANDSFGHRAGDEVIRVVAARLSERLRQSDVLARLGGDEFAILLPYASVAGAVQVAEDLLACVRESPVVLDRAAGRVVHLTASLGIAVFSGPESAGQDLLALADAAMYEAKERGRNGIAVYDAGAGRQEAMARNVALVQRLREALAGEGFELYAQPILDLASRELTHSEVLLRLRAADGELIPPGEFLPLAESFGLMPDVDRWVVREAIALAAAHQRAGIDLRLEINLSAQSLGNRCLLGAIESELERLAVDPARLIFEVTETAAIANVAHAREFIERLRAIGCSFALDDFGAGYGSFRYLKHLPFDYLKIDGEFIRDLPRDEDDRLVVQALVAAARGLGKRVVAEFVGDDETIELLDELGVHYAQGFHIARPAPVAEAARLRAA